MPDAQNLAELYLEQLPGCQWVVSASGIFERFFGDPTPLFGRGAAELTGRSPAEVLEKESGVAWSGRFARALEGETKLLPSIRAPPTM